MKLDATNQRLWFTASSYIYGSGALFYFKNSGGWFDDSVNATYFVDMYDSGRWNYFNNNTQIGYLKVSTIEHAGTALGFFGTTPVSKTSSTTDLKSTLGQCKQ